MGVTQAVSQGAGINGDYNLLEILWKLLWRMVMKASTRSLSPRLWLPSALNFPMFYPVVLDGDHTAVSFVASGSWARSFWGQFPPLFFCWHVWNRIISMASVYLLQHLSNESFDVALGNWIISVLLLEVPPCEPGEVLNPRSPAKGVNLLWIDWKTIFLFKIGNDVVEILCT